MEYSAQVASPTVSGEVKLAIGDKSFSIKGAFDILEIPYAEINSIVFADYTVKVSADSGEYAFGRMGEWAQRFYDALCEAFNKAVLRSLFVQGSPAITATGDYSFRETGGSGSRAKAKMQVFENCVVALPPDLGARRIPLCFLSGMDAKDFTLTLKLESNDTYSFSKLGYDTDITKQTIEKNKRAMLEKALSAVKKLDPSVPSAAASQLAKHLQQGAAAQLGVLSSISPSFVEVLEGKIAQTRAAEYYSELKTMCESAKIFVGFTNASNWGTAGAGGDYYWFIAPSKSGKYAIVEFSEANTATFIYRTNGSFDAFARQLNRALEAINFKREVISLSDAELRKPEYADYYMASKRTSALKLVRANFEDRIVHTTPAAWKRKIEEITG